MALSSANLGSELEQAVRTSQNLGATPYPQLTSYCNAIAQAIVDHFVNNAQITNTQVLGQTESALINPNTHVHDVDDLTVTGGIV